MKQHRIWFYCIALVLLLPALLIHLGLQTFIDDEAIRSLVALEMKLSGNYITPTIHGEYYFNKPPLFNWILLAFFELTGRINEWTARLVTVLALLGYAATIYYFFRRRYSVKTAFLNAFVLVTCGRILFWDSMLALIDITFSWVVFTSFMVIYFEMERGRYYRLFLLSYLLAAIAFLLKGLPAVVFQGVTLLVYFSFRRRVRLLFSPAHILGGLVFLVIVGSYYLVYHHYNGLETVFSTLFHESSKRTVLQNSWAETLLHLFTFPFEMVYHFLPWSLWIVYFFRRDIVSLIRKDPFITFNLVVFLANILVYWTSPAVHPRYLLMLAPLLFSAFLYLHDVHAEEGSWQFRFLNRLFGVVLLFLALGAFAPLFLERTAGIPYLIPKTLGTGLVLLGLYFLYRRLPAERLLILVLFLLVFRIEFNWFILPDRNAHDFGDTCRQTSKEVGRRFVDRELYLYKEVEMQPTNSFYLTNERQQIIPRKIDSFPPDAVYIIDPALYPGLSYEKLDEIRVRHGQLTYDVGLLKND